MRIGEIAKAADVTTSRIRFYERRGIISPAARGDNGYRDYPSDLINRLKFIELAQQLGFTLREIATVQSGDNDHPVSCEEAIELLTAKLLSVEELIAEAKQRKQKIEAQIEKLKKTQSA